MLHYLILLAIAVLPVVLLMVYVYRQDKYQKEPVKSLIKAFVGGIIAIPLDILLVLVIGVIFNDTWFSQTVFFSSFMEAGIPEELCKFIIFMIFIWRDKNFDEYFDGIIYASFIGLGFACVENIEYVFQFGFGTGVIRALLSVPGHFLFGVLMGYFLSMAKFRPEQRGKYLWSGLLLAMLAHGLFDWLLMFANWVPYVGGIIYTFFLAGDIALWRLGLKYIKRQQQNSLEQANANDPDFQLSDNEFDTEYKQIDWNAGNKQ